MTLLYPQFLVLFIPLVLLWLKSKNNITIRIHVIILALIVITLSRPVIESMAVNTPIESRNIIIALDVSYSMQATDIKPTRYEFSKQVIGSFLEQNPTDNVMLIAFTTNPLLLSPPTTDHTLINIALQSLNPEHILTKGTSLDKLFTKIASFSKMHTQLVLISDGGEEKDVKSLSSILSALDITLITLATGTDKGVTIKSKNNTLIKDKEGNLIISRINPILKALTDALDGSYIQASSSVYATANFISNALLSDAKTYQSIQKMQTKYQEWYHIPLLFAIILFFILHTKAVKYLLIVLTFLGAYANASIFDTYRLNNAYQAYDNKHYLEAKRELIQIETPSLQSQFLLANTLYRTNEFKKSILRYKSILSKSVKVKQTLFYNIANAYVELGKYSKARFYYAKVLQLGKHEDTHHNLQYIATLHDKDNALLGIAHPKSQNSSSSKSDTQEKNDKTKQEEDTPSSGASNTGEKKKTKDSNKLLSNNTPQKLPLGSKVYELINKGYIYEKQPW